MNNRLSEMIKINSITLLREQILK